MSHAPKDLPGALAAALASLRDTQVMPGASFLAVRKGFDAQIRILPASVTIAPPGFGRFAWAGNPPDKPAVERPGLSIRVIR